MVVALRSSLRRRQKARYVRTCQAKLSIEADFLAANPVNGKMRSVLVDWLAQVHQKFRLLPETMYTTVMILDRYLQVVFVISPVRSQFLSFLDKLLAYSPADDCHAFECDTDDSSGEGEAAVGGRGGDARGQQV